MKNIFSLVFVNLKYFSNLKNKIYQFILFVEPLFNLFLVYLLARLSDKTLTSENILYSGIMGAITFSLYSSGSIIVIEKWSSTMELLEAAPTNFFNFIFSKAISNSLISLIPLGVNLFYAIFLFRVEFQTPNLLGTLFSMTIVLIVSLTSIGGLLAVVFGQSKNAIELQNLFLVPLILISGVWLQNVNLPRGFLIITSLSPIKWTIDCILDTINGNSVLSKKLFYSFILSFIYIVTSSIFLKFFEKKFRMEGKYSEF